MSILKAGLLLVTGAVLGGGVVCELLRRRENSKSYEVSLIKGVATEPSESDVYMLNGQLNTVSTSPFRMHVIQDFKLEVTVADDGIYFIPKHSDLEVVMLVKECMGLNQIDGVIFQLGQEPEEYHTVRTGEGWKASKIAGDKSTPVDVAVEVPVTEPVKEAKSNLRRAQPLKA